jgi:spoIIIJ-associated protein
MNHIQDSGPAVKKIADFLKTVIDTGGLNLKSNILACNGQVQPTPSDPAGILPHASKPPLRPAASPNTPGLSVPDISVEFTGPDTSLLLARNGELLHALEHMAAKILRLEPEDHDLISFDAEHFKANRDRDLHLSAELAIQKVRTTGQPHPFPPMTSRERRIVHLALAGSGLPTASSGDGPRRFVVLYPEGHEPAPETPAAPSPDRARAIRSSFRRR